MCIEAANHKLNDAQIKILSEAQKLGLSDDLCIEAAYHNVSVEDLQYVQTCDVRNYRIETYDAALPSVVLMRKLGYSDGYMLKEGITLTEQQTKILQEAFNQGLNEVYMQEGASASQSSMYTSYGQQLCLEAAKAGIPVELLPKLKEFVQTEYTLDLPDLAVKYFENWVKNNYRYY